jgi:hypothetical protein
VLFFPGPDIVIEHRTATTATCATTR